MKWKQVNVQSFIRIIYEDKRQKSFGLIENDDDDDDECKEERGYQTVASVTSHQMSVKVGQKWFH